MPDTELYKQSAVDFLRLVVAGHIADAYKQYVDMNGIHHNLYFAAGFPALQKGMEENHLQFPNKTITVNNVFADGNRVAVHSLVQMQMGEKGIAVVHMFRFDGGKIVEMWDVGVPIPDDSPNTDGAF